MWGQIIASWPAGREWTYLVIAITSANQLADIYRRIKGANLVYIF